MPRHSKRQAAAPVSAAVKVGAALTVVLPFCTFVYTEQQKAKGALETRRLHALRLKDEQIDRDRANDARNGDALAKAIAADLAAGGNGAKLCEFVNEHLIAIETGQLGSASLNALVSSLAEPSNDAPKRQKGCECSNLVVPRIEKSVHRFSQHLQNVLGRQAVAQMLHALAQFTLHSDDTMPAACQQERPPDRRAPQMCIPQTAQTQAKPKKKQNNAVKPGQPAPVASSAGAPASRAGVPRSCKPSPQQQQEFKFQSATPPPRLYIQIGDEGDRDSAQCVQDWLRAAGIFVPGIENVGRRSPRTLQLRYFNAQQGIETSMAGAVRAALGAAQVSIASDSALDPGINISALKSNARNNHFELWFPAR